MSNGSGGGALVISLDFELAWGVRDQPFFSAYRENLSGARAAIPRILECFVEYGIHATWATVGLLFFQSKDELKAGLPAKRPRYRDAALSSYSYLDQLGSDEETDPLHFAPSLIDLIGRHPHQEVATHTLSHYYCLEEQQDVEAFRDDLAAALTLGRRRGIELESLVFPRNQFDDQHVQACNEVGIKSFRGVESAWLYAARRTGQESMVRRGIRLLDAYINISGHHGYPREHVGRTLPHNLPSSRFLRPYSAKLRLLEPLKRRRIAADLSHAAANDLIYHLWWHPHNFGTHLEESLTSLRAIFDHFVHLKDRYGMESLNMAELSAQLRETG